jgi:hypothetical protein
VKINDSNQNMQIDFTTVKFLRMPKNQLKIIQNEINELVERLENEETYYVQKAVG